MTPPRPLVQTVRAVASVGSGVLAYTRPSDVPDRFRGAHRLVYSLASGGVTTTVGTPAFTGRDDSDDLRTNIGFGLASAALTYVTYGLSFRLTEATDSWLARHGMPNPRLGSALFTTAVMYGTTLLLDTVPEDADDDGEAAAPGYVPARPVRDS
ncbi:hypothetical protein [Brevibacterium samyangense]|uniref:hypothetical protein n=1 Tax=Brevibacterium samyangense TaxID=366888 RepID=UPI0031D0AB40